MNGVQLFGALLLVLSAAGYCWSFMVQERKPAMALGLLLLCGLLLRIYASADMYLHSWDERYHALVAKHLSEHMLQPTLYERVLLPYDYKNWTINHIWLHKQPLALWCMALSIKLFGAHAWVVRMPSVIASVLSINLMHSIARYFYNNRVAYLSAFLFSIQGLIIELAAGRTDTDHVDVLLLFFVLLGVWASTLYTKKRTLQSIVLVGLAIGAAVLTKWLPGLVIFPLWLVIAIDKVSVRQLLSDGIVVLLIACAIALPWQVYIHQHYLQEALWEAAYNRAHFFNALEGHAGSVFYYVDQLRIMYGEVVYIAVILAGVVAYRQRRRANLIVLLWFGGVFVFYSVAATKMPAYTLIAAPAILMMTANGYIYFIGKRHFFVRMIGVCLLLLPVRYTMERIKPLEGICADKDWNKQIATFATGPLNTDKTVVLNCPRYIELMFATQCTAYERAPDEQYIAHLRQQGYNVVFFDRLYLK